MFRKLILIVILAGLNIYLFANDLLPQKIGITVDRNNPNYVVDLILKKTLLTETENSKDIVLLSGDKTDLENAGIKELNGNLLINTLIEQEYYKVCVYSANSSGTVLIDNSVSFETNKLIDFLPTATMRIFSNLLKIYPPKEKKELQVMEIEKVKLSEFEPVNLTWRLYAAPYYNGVRLKLGFKKDLDSGTRGQTFNSPGAGAAANIQLNYHQFSAWAGMGGSFGIWGDFSSSSVFARLGGGIGVFGSLLIIGVEGVYCQANLSSQNSMNFIFDNYSTNTNIPGSKVSIPVPDIFYQTIMPCLTLQLNFNKNYYIKVSGAFPLAWGNLRVNFKNSEFTLPQNFNFDSFNGPPFIDFYINFGITEKLRVYAFYSFLGRNHNFWNNGDTTPLLINPSQGLFIEQFELSQIQMGIGVDYEF
jgi:hypothetical protein